MRTGFCLVCLLLGAGCTTTAFASGGGPPPSEVEVPGWGRVVDPSQDSRVSFDRENDRLRIQLPGTPHILSAEVPALPMNAPRVLRRVRGDFTATVHVLGRLEPGQSPTTGYEPYHGAGLIVWQDSSNYLRVERSVGFIGGRRVPYINYELRTGGQLTVTRGIPSEDRPLFLKLRRQGAAFWAWFSRDGRRWVELGEIDATFAERIEIGVVAVNSSKEPFSAELETLDVEDPQGSMARDYGDDGLATPMPPLPASTDIRPVRPMQVSAPIEPGPRRNPSVRHLAPVMIEPTRFHW